MPIYEYRCKKCGAQLEVLLRSSDKPPKRCRECGGALEKQFSSPAIQFKGEGWYVTDYARKGSVAEKAEKESSSDGGSDKPAGGDKDKEKKTPAKKTGKD